MALEARPDGREPGVALAAEAVFGLLALGAVQGGGTATPGDTEQLSVSPEEPLICESHMIR